VSSEVDFDTIKSALKKASEKLVTAQIDINNARYDDSVSRAYYGVFHAISAVLLTKGLHYSSHSQLIGNFNKEFVKTGIFTSGYTKILYQLFEGRQRGDYDFESNIAKEEAETYLKDAKNLFNECKKYLIYLGMPDDDNTGVL